MRIRLLFLSCWMIKWTSYAFELPKSRMDNIFTRHNSFQINEIFASLYQYSCKKSKTAASRLERSRFEDLSCDIYKARSYTETRRDYHCVYLGWTPLVHHEPQRKDSLVVRNDNVQEENTLKPLDYRTIPLYFIFLTIIPERKVISVEKIIHNPTIETKVDVYHIKTHLEFLAEDSNTTLEMFKLKHHDSGRWFFEFCFPH